jgi:hypothetical protein
VGEPIDLGPVAARLEAYNSGPRAVRAQGRLRVKGRGSADFGARAADGVGFRIDVVTGPFSAPALALACRADGGCEAYVPDRRTVYRDDGSGLEGWFGALLRGRVPQLGSPDVAWGLPDGRSVLRLTAVSGWREEVEFDAASGLPARTVLSRWEEPVAEVIYADYFRVGEHPFPGSLTVRVQEPPRVYVIEFRRVVPDGEVPDGIFALVLPHGTAVDDIRGSTTWKETGIPFWLPTPER